MEYEPSRFGLAQTRFSTAEVDASYSYARSGIFQVSAVRRASTRNVVQHPPISVQPTAIRSHLVGACFTTNQVGVKIQQNKKLSPPKPRHSRDADKTDGKGT
jgi:hypothetical protein